MIDTRRHLPHWIPDHVAVFVTWRLAGYFPREGQSFRGALWLQDPRIAKMVNDALLYGEASGRYDLHAWVIMPNHVHAIVEPHTPLPQTMQWLKGRTARLANRILNRTGQPFWQEESFDHWIRSPEEFDYFVTYIENNPVKAGLEYLPWSSVGRRQETIVCPT
jgi:REP element-mobilizing transposase RayT